MKQILQNLRNGKVTLVEVPSPVINAGQVLIETRASLISAYRFRPRAVFGNCLYSWSVMFSLSVPGLLAIVLWFSCLSDLCRVSFAEVLTSAAPRL